MTHRFKTNYPGVYYRLTRRIGKKGEERVYYIVFKKDGKVFEEKVGRQFVDDMTPAKAALIRGERIERKRKSRKEIRIEQEQERRAQQSRWTIARLWPEYLARREKPLKGLVQDQHRYKNYIAPAFGEKEPNEIAETDVDTFGTQLRKTLKPATVNNTLELLRRICNFGKVKKLCSGIQFTIKIPKVYNKKTEDLTDEQLTRLLQAMEEDENQQAADIMKLVLHTGMRRGEIFRLKKADIDYNFRRRNETDPPAAEKRTHL
jgi:integrase